MATGTVALSLVAASTIVQYMGNKEEAKAQVKAAKQQSEAKRLQANEILARFKLNEESLNLTKQTVTGSQIAAMAKGGGSGSSVSDLLLLEDTNMKIQRQIKMEKREADFKAESLMRGADIDMSLAGDIDRASTIQNIGIFLNRASKAANIKYST